MAISEEIKNFPFLNNPREKDQCIFIANIFESVHCQAHPAWGASHQIGNYNDQLFNKCVLSFPLHTLPLHTLFHSL